MRDLFERVARAEERLLASEKAISIAHAAIEKRLEGQNEFREQLREQAASFVTRHEIDIKFESQNSNRKDNIAIILAVLGILISVIPFLLKALKQV